MAMQKCSFCGTWYDIEEGKSRPHRIIDFILSLAQRGKA